MGKHYPEVQLVYAIRGNKCRGFSVLHNAVALSQWNLMKCFHLFLDLLCVDEHVVFLEFSSASGHKIAGTDCHWHARNHAGLVWEVQVHWPQEDQGVCSGWGWRHDRHTGSPRPEFPHPEVCNAFKLWPVFLKSFPDLLLLAIHCSHLCHIGCCPKTARCCCFPPLLKRQCGGSPSASCLTQTSSSCEETRRRWILSNSTMCCATARRRSSKPCVTSMEPSPSPRPWSSAMWVLSLPSAVDDEARCSWTSVFLFYFEEINSYSYPLLMSRTRGFS